MESVPKVSDEQKQMLMIFLMKAGEQRVSILTDEEAKNRNMHIHDQTAFKEYQEVVKVKFDEHDLDKDGYHSKEEHLAFCKSLNKYNDEKHGGTD